MAKFLLVLALAGSVGLHWVLLQTVAWTGMIISYSRDAALTEAVGRTFDGQHPCELCKLIRAEKKSEQKAARTLTQTKLELALPPDNFSLVRVGAQPCRAVSAARPRSHLDSPPAPPPRAA